MNLNNRPELLLPVGNMEMLLAAIHNGGDAVYIGMPEFNARGRTKDFSIIELQEMVELAHLYGVKVYLAFNILIFENELELAISKLKEVLPLGLDAIIVQDIALAKIIKELSPSQVVHASTQMTITSNEHIKFIEDLKFKRVVLGREVSLSEMKIIKENTTTELEAFVHGALCVSYSGQCLTSESIGGRSANRGQCAQSCRLEYELIANGEKVDTKKNKYFVSPKDLCGINEIDELAKIGIHSLKVEGRLKTKEYVAAAGKYYKDAIYNIGNKKEAIENLNLTYSRGFYSGWLHGVNHQQLVDGTYSAHQGLLIGKVTKINLKEKTIVINSIKSLNLGDGLLFKNNIGAKIYNAKMLKEDTYQLAFNNQFDLKSIIVDSEVYLNSSDSFVSAINSNVTDKKKQKQIPITFSVTAKMGQALIASITDGTNTITLKTDSLLTKSLNSPLSKRDLEAEFKKLGGSCYALKELTISLDENLFMNAKELKTLRQNLISKLNELRITPLQIKIKEYKLQNNKYETISTSLNLNVLIRKNHQVNALSGLSLGSVILDFEYGKDYKESVLKLKSMGHLVGIATTRILKPLEYKNLKVIVNANPDFILVRNLSALQVLKDWDLSIPLLGDYSLNVTNSITADYLLNKGLKSIVPSYDLNTDQLTSFIKASDPSRIELTIHQYIPEFHMEHCVFAAFLSDGTSFKNCGLVCEKHTLELKDPYLNMHHIVPDQECRNTMYRATPQSASKLLIQMKKMGVKNFRLEALVEDEVLLRTKIETYLDLLNEKISSEELFNKLNVVEKYGITSGQLLKGQTYHDRKK